MNTWDFSKDILLISKGHDKILFVKLNTRKDMALVMILTELNNSADADCILMNTNTKSLLPLFHRETSGYKEVHQ